MPPPASSSSGESHVADHSNRQLRELPSSLRGVACLETSWHIREVNLAFNTLASLHGLVEACPQLERLSVSHNKLRSLPSLGSLSRLCRLDASSNALSDTSSLSGCPALAELWLANNQLELPALLPLASLPVLRDLVLHGNPCQRLSPTGLCRHACALLLPTVASIDAQPVDAPARSEAKRFLAVPGARDALQTSLGAKQALALLNGRGAVPPPRTVVGPPRQRRLGGGGGGGGSCCCGQSAAGSSYGEGSTQGGGSCASGGSGGGRGGDGGSVCGFGTGSTRPWDGSRGGGGRGGGGAGGSGHGGGESLLSKWAASNAAAALARSRAADGYGGEAHAPRAMAAAPTVAPPISDAQAFPTLGGGGKARAGAGGGGSSSGGGVGNWTRVAAAPAVTPFFGGGGGGGGSSSSSSSSLAPPPPREYQAAPQEFPSLGAAVTVEKAKSAATVPRDRDELISRNKLLMVGLQAAAKRNGTPDAVSGFRALSANFQRGDVTAMAYFRQFSNLFGEETTHSLFPELVLLLPDQQKREELSRVFDAFDRSRPLLGQGGRAPPPPAASKAPAVGAGVGVFASGKPTTWGGRGTL